MPQAEGRQSSTRRWRRLWRPAAVIAVVAALLLWERYPWSDEPAGPPPNIVLITIDTLRADHLGCYGYEAARTDVIDAFASSAVQFDLTTTCSNHTLPSHLAIHIGDYPHAFGVPKNGFTLPEGRQTLATILQARGYETAAFVGSFALDANLGIDRGFDIYDQDFEASEIGPYERRASDVIDRATEWLRDRGEKPFFLWVHCYDPHLPYRPPDPYDSLFYPEYEGPADGSLEFAGSIGGRWGQEKVEATPEDLRKLVALYDGEIAYTDASLERLFSLLDEPAHQARTLVVFTGDHGESLTEHDYYFDHGHFTYQPSMHVPLIVRPPGYAPSPERRRIADPVETIDVFATVLAHAGLTPPEGVPSRDLTPLCRGESIEPLGMTYGEASFPEAYEERYPGEWLNIGKAQFVLDYPWKLIVTPHEDLLELYRLDRDPGELENLAESHPDDVSRLGIALREWRKGATAEVSQPEFENLRKLRSLGYVGD